MTKEKVFYKLDSGIKSNEIAYILNYSETKDKCNPKIIENNKELKVDDTIHVYNSL